MSQSCGCRGIHPCGPQDELAAIKQEVGEPRRAWQLAEAQICKSCESGTRGGGRWRLPRGDAEAKGHPQSGSPTHLGSGRQENGRHRRDAEKLREGERARGEVRPTLLQYNLIQTRSHSQPLGGRTSRDLFFRGHNSTHNSFPN